MLWRKESAIAGLGGGVDTKGGCNWALSLEDFQYMLDPLDASKEYGDLVKEMKVSVYFIWSTVYIINYVKHVELCN